MVKENRSVKVKFLNITFKFPVFGKEVDLLDIIQEASGKDLEEIWQVIVFRGMERLFRVPVDVLKTHDADLIEETLLQVEEKGNFFKPVEGLSIREIEQELATVNDILQRSKKVLENCSYTKKESKDDFTLEPSDDERDNAEDALSALISLGFKKRVAQRRLNRIWERAKKNGKTSVEDLIKLALSDKK